MRRGMGQVAGRPDRCGRPRSRSRTLAGNGERKLKKIDCDEVLDQLSEYIDEETRAELCEAIKEHLARCRDCQIKVDTVKKTIVLYQSHSSVELPMHATARLTAALAREYGREPGSTD